MTKALTLQDTLQQPAIQSRINEVLGKKAPQFASSLIQISKSNKLLAKAEPASLISSAMMAASLDLPINQSLGFAWIVPYKNQAQFQIGYKGLIQLAMRSGQFKSLNDVAVPEGALKSFNPVTGDYELDLDVWDDDLPKVGYLVHFELLNGFKKTVYWTKTKVEAHAKRFSQAFRKGYNCPWKDDFDAMALKTVLKHALNKYAPLSIEMEKAIINDQSVSDLDGNIDYVDNIDQVTEDAQNQEILLNELNGEKSAEELDLPPFDEAGE